MDKEFEILNKCLDKASEMNEAVKELNVENNASYKKLKEDADMLLTTISVCLANAEEHAE